MNHHQQLNELEVKQLEAYEKASSLGLPEALREIHYLEMVKYSLFTSRQEVEFEGFKLRAEPVLGWQFLYTLWHNKEVLYKEIVEHDAIVLEVFRSGNWIEKVKDYLRQAKAAKDEADKEQFKEACSNFEDYNL